MATKLILTRRQLVARASHTVDPAVGTTLTPKPIVIYSRFLPGRNPSEDVTWEQLDLVYRLQPLLKNANPRVALCIPVNTKYRFVLETPEGLRQVKDGQMKNGLFGHIDLDAIRKYAQLFPPEAIPANICIMVRKGGPRAASEYYGLLLA